MRTPMLMLALLAIGALAGYGIYLAFLQPAPLAVPPSDQSGGFVSPGQDQPSGGIRVTLIEAPGCDSCNEDGYVLKQAEVILLQRTEVPVLSKRTLQVSDPEAVALISKYNLPALPVAIIEGPVGDYPDLVSHWEQTLGVESQGALISAPLPPYQLVSSGEVVGILQGVAINPSDCRDCVDASSFLLSLQNLPASMVFSDLKTYSQDDPEAARLIERLNITDIPTIVVSDQIQAYPIYSELSKIGDIRDGWYVLRDVPAPFVDLEANETRGLVKAIYLFDQSCTECFDIRSFAAYISEATGIYIEQETYFDVRSDTGAQMVKDYGITNIPTLMLSSDSDYYFGFRDAWLSQGNSIEDDGWYIFRAHGLLENGTYLNLSG